MTRRTSLRKWARLAGLSAALLPIAQAQAATTTDGAVIRLDGDRLYLSEAGGAFRELSLGDTPRRGRCAHCSISRAVRRASD